MLQCSEDNYTSKKTGISVVGDDGKVNIIPIILLYSCWLYEHTNLGIKFAFILLVQLFHTAILFP